MSSTPMEQWSGQASKERCAEPIGQAKDRPRAAGEPPSTIQSAFPDDQKTIRVLLLEDNPTDVALVEAILSHEGFNPQVTVIASGEDLEMVLRSETFDIVIADYSVPSYDGFRALELRNTMTPDLPFILFTGTIGEEHAVETIRRGATDYVVKQRADRLGPAVRRALVERRELKRRQAAEAELDRSLSLLRSIVEQVEDVIEVLTPDGQRAFASPSHRDLMGSGGEGGLTGTIHALDHPRVAQWFSLAATTGQSQRGDYRVQRPDGSIRHIESQWSPIRDANQNLTHILIVSRDVTQRKWAEQVIRESLQEKEVLLREIHHRVKNNMQIIGSLLRLQSDSLSNPEAAEALRASQGRIRSMALIHEQLYQSHSLASIDLSEYLREILHMVARNFQERRDAIQLKVDLPTVSFGLDIAIPVGLIIHELFLNALKYAFPEDRTGDVTLTFAKELGTQPSYELTLADNGVGLPESLDTLNPKTLGLRLVRMLAKQLQGTLNVASRPGRTEFTLRFQDRTTAGDEPAVPQPS